MVYLINKLDITETWLQDFMELMNTSPDSGLPIEILRYCSPLSDLNKYFLVSNQSIYCLVFSGHYNCFARGIQILEGCVDCMYTQVK